MRQLEWFKNRGIDTSKTGLDGLQPDQLDMLIGGIVSASAHNRITKPDTSADHLAVLETLVTSLDEDAPTEDTLNYINTVCRHHVENAAKV